MGDYFNDSGWYEQQRESHFRAQAEREQEMARNREIQQEQMARDDSERIQRESIARRNNGLIGGSISGGLGSSGRSVKGQQQRVETAPDITFRGIFWRIICFWILFPIFTVVINGLLLHFTGFSKYPLESLSFSSMLAALVMALIWFLAKYKAVASFYGSVGSVFLVAIIKYGLANAVSTNGVLVRPVIESALLLISLLVGIFFLPIILVVGYQSIPGFTRQVRKGIPSERYNWPIALIPLTVLVALVGYFGNHISVFFAHFGITLDFLVSLAGFGGCLDALSVLATVVGIGTLLVILWKSIQQTWTGVRVLS